MSSRCLGVEWPILSRIVAIPQVPQVPRQPSRTLRPCASHSYRMTTCGSRHALRDLRRWRRPPTRDFFTIVRTRTRPPSIGIATRRSANSVSAGSPPRRHRGRSRGRVASICVPSSPAVTALDPDQAEGLWYGMRSWIAAGFPLRKRGGGQWPAPRRTDPDRVERWWLVRAVAPRSVRAVGREADEAEFAGATIPEPAGPSAPGRPLASGARGRARARRRGGASREAPAREPRRRTGTKPRLVSIFRPGLEGLMSVLIAGPALPKPSWKPKAWWEVRCEIQASPHQPPTPIPQNPSL